MTTEGKSSDSGKIRKRARRVIISTLVALAAIGILATTTSSRRQQDIDELRQALEPGNVLRPGWHKLRELEGLYSSEHALSGVVIHWLDAPTGRECQAVVAGVAPSAPFVRVNDTVIRDEGAPLDFDKLAMECGRDRVVIRFWSPDLK